MQCLEYHSAINFVQVIISCSPAWIVFSTGSNIICALDERSGDKTLLDRETCGCCSGCNSREWRMGF